MKSNQENQYIKAEVTIKAKVNQTEDQTKVENSILNMVTEKHSINIIKDNYLILKGDLSLLLRIKNRINKNEQEELIKYILEKNRKDSLLKFFINKQSAFNNTFHIIDESMSTLGDIEVEIITDYPEEVIEWFSS